MAALLFPRKAANAVTTHDLINDSRDFKLGQNRQIIIYPGTKFQVVLPPQYQMHMGCFLWREAVIRLILRFSDQIALEKLLEDNLIMILQYMDNIFKRVSEEARGLNGTESDFHSTTFDEYLVIEYYVRRHEPFEIRKFRRTHDTNLNWMKLSECDWQQYMKEMGPIWSGDRNLFKLPSTAQNLKSVSELFQSLKLWYSPYVIPDKYFGYTYQEHEGSSEEDSDKEVVPAGSDLEEMDVESGGESGSPPTGSVAKASKNVQGTSQEMSKTLQKGKKAPEPQIKAQEKGKGKAKTKTKAKKAEIAVEGSKGATGHSRVTRSSQKKKVIS